MSKKIKFSADQKDDIRQKYLVDKKTISEISQYYKVSETPIKSLFHELNISARKASEISRKYSINQHYFDSVDSFDKAYFLGLLMADGYNNEKRGCVTLKTAEWIKSYENKLFKIYGTKINLVYGDCLVKMSKCKGCDLLMTSPPFLDVERYVGVKFEVEYDKWLTDFIDPFIKMGYGCLRVGGKMAVYLEKIDGRDFLKDFTEYAVKNGFQELNPVRFKMSYGENMRDKKETRSVPVLVFQK